MREWDTFLLNLTIYLEKQAVAIAAAFHDEKLFKGLWSLRCGVWWCTWDGPRMDKSGLDERRVQIMESGKSGGICYW
ncbi:unnamed protein product [Acanthocheilonema viteae]|uniref:Uncharacterized protein n=1 Tax=Acanthocheilonema viteae TaxID=6277 RepID=A0A498SLG9_ACAVI|nr:unnamed protein product [Acanthocheilonema viteae]